MHGKLVRSIGKQVLGIFSYGVAFDLKGMCGDGPEQEQISQAVPRWPPSSDHTPCK